MIKIYVYRKKFIHVYSPLWSIDMTREEKIKLALVLIAISSYVVGFAPLGQRIGGPEVI